MVGGVESDAFKEACVSMTIFKADSQTFVRWGAAIEREMDLTQALAADPHRKRTFRLIGSGEFMEMTGATPWQWKAWTKRLKEEDRLPPFTAINHVKITLEQMHEYMDRQNVRPSRPDGVSRGIRVAIANFKGGAAKSTTTFHFGTRLAMQGYKVLLVDLDGQATLTRMLALQPYLLKSEQTFAAAIGMQDDGDDVVSVDPMPLSPMSTYISGLDIVPAGMAVTSIDMELMQRIREGSSSQVYGLFEQALAGVDENYDFVLMDFQPSFSLSQLLVLRLADSILLPVPTETPDLAGTGDFMKLAGRWLGELETLFGSKSFDPVMALHVRSKARNAMGDQKLSEEKKAELDEQMQISNVVFGMAGRVFGNHRPMQLIEDRPVVGACLANLKSVYEADQSDYDLRAIKVARQQYDVLLARVMEAVQLRWQEVMANGGSYE